MALNTNYKNDSTSYPHVETTQNLTKALRVGFEWEIPLHRRFFAGVSSADSYREECFSDQNDMKSFFKGLGYKNHLECGGHEICSPVFPTLKIAKGHANNMIKLVNSFSYFDPKAGNKYGANCGIHVHVSPRSGLTDGQQLRLAGFMGAVGQKVPKHMTYGLFKKFWSVLAQRNGGAYMCNAEPRFIADRSAVDSCTNYSMFKANTPLRGVRTIEVRVFGPKQDSLIPALEFSHSFFKFCEARYEKKGMDKVVNVPTMVDYYNWLMKQKGYKTLKENKAWKILKG